MNTPLQKAAQEILEIWDAPEWQNTLVITDVIAELRKALDAEIAQSVEPVGHFLDCGNLQGWREVHDDYKDDADVAPLYLHPPQPQATTAVPEGYVLVPIEPTDEMIEAGCDLSEAYRVDMVMTYKAMLAAAQVEKP